MINPNCGCVYRALKTQKTPSLLDYFCRAFDVAQSSHFLDYIRYIDLPRLQGCKCNIRSFPKVCSEHKGV